MVLEALKLPYAWNEIDTRSGTTRTPEFLAKNPNGKLPLLEIDSGVYLAESNAIIFYLAEGTPLLPNARLERAQVLQWLFFEQYSHEPYIAVARFLRRFHPDPGSQRALTDYALDAMTLVDAVGVPFDFAPTVHQRVLEKVRREAGVLGSHANEAEVGGTVAQGSSGGSVSR